MKKTIITFLLCGLLNLTGVNFVLAANDVTSVVSYEDTEKLMNVNNELYFTAIDSAAGKANLYKYNTVSKIITGLIDKGSDSKPVGMIILNGDLYFCILNENVYFDLWKSNGTVAGTVMVKENILPYEDDERQEFFYAYNGKLFYRGEDNELWMYNSSTNQAQIVKDINTSYESWPSNFINYNNKLYFVADDGSGSELWRTDGTEAGTVLVKNISASGWSAPEKFTISNNLLYFVANNGVNGYELWRSDGTSGGTVMVKDINPNNNTNGNMSMPSELVDLNGVLFFSANNGINGNELWRSDGTSGGTVMVKDINTGASSSNPNRLYVFNNNIYFGAYTTDYGNELWRSDGTSAGTVMVKNINGGSSGSNPSNFLSANNLLYFVADNGVNGYEVWKTDGTTNNTTLLKEVIIGFSGFYPEFLTNVNNVLFFSAIENWGSKKIWSYDTTIETTGVGVSGLCYASSYKAKTLNRGQSIAKPQLSQAQINKYKGKFVKANTGNVFYVNPRTYALDLVNDDPLYYLSKIAIGMKNRDIDRLSDLSAETANSYSKKFANKIIMQVQNKCVLWYVNSDGKKTKIDNPLGLVNFLATQL